MREESKQVRMGRLRRGFLSARLTLYDQQGGREFLVTAGSRAVVVKERGGFGQMTLVPRTSVIKKSSCASSTRNIRHEWFDRQARVK